MNKISSSLSHLYQEVVSILRSKTGHQTSLVFSMEIITAGFGFLANVFVIRKLSIEEYGVFSIFSSTIMLVGGFSHLGWLDSFTRFGSSHRLDSSLGAVIKFFFVRIILSVASVSFLWVIFARPISLYLLKKPEMSTLLILAVCAAALLTLTSFFANFLKIQQKFKELFYFQSAHSAFRFFLLFALLILGLARLENVLLVYTCVPFLFLVFHGLYFREICINNCLSIWNAPPLPKTTKTEIANFNGWLLLSTFTTCLIGNIDAYFLAFYHGSSSEVANLGAASRLTLPINMIVTSLGIVILPKLSGSKNISDLKIYCDKLLKFLAPASILVFTLGTISIPILKFIAGEKYADIGTILFLQVISLTLIFATNPIGILLFIWGKTKNLALLNFAQLIIDVLLNIALIPSYGARGAIGSTIVVNLCGFTYLSFASRKYYLENKGNYK